MALPPMGRFLFPGLNSVLGATMTLAHGTAPSFIVCRITPQNNFTVPQGTAQFVYGNEPPITFPDCKIDIASLDVGTGGQVWTLRIADRRWKWAFGEITGRYNLVKPNGRIDLDTEKSPQDLAKLLLKEMGEVRFDVSQLPNETRPYVEWASDNPAEMLNRLVEPLGCRVVLGLDNRVRICLLGTGANLPTTRIMGGGFGFDPPEKPDAIKVVCAPTQFQARIVLEAVGLDTDGTVKLIKDLSYNPLGVNAVQTVTLEGPPTAGTFTLSFDGDTTSTISFDATAASVLLALESLPGIGEGNITVSGSAGGPYVITFINALSHQAVPPVVADISNLAGATNYTTTMTTVGASGEGEPNGWITQYPDTFGALIGADTQSESIRQLALKTVYRWYRIKEMATGDMEVPEFGTLDDIKQILPLTDVLLDIESGISNLGERYPQPMHAAVYGKFYDTTPDPKTMANRTEGTPYPFGFTIDLDRGIVQFNDPVYMIVKLDTDVYSNSLTLIAAKGSFAYFPAQLLLECVFNIRNYKNHQTVRHSKVRKIGNGRNKTKPKIIKREDLAKTVRVRYVSPTNTAVTINDTTTYLQAISPPTALVVRDIITNENGTGLTIAGGGVDAGLDGKMDYYLDAEEALYRNRTTKSYKYLKIMPISPDGKIHQVTFNVGTDGATTEASENDEVNRYVPSYDEKRLAQITIAERKRIAAGGKPKVD